MNDILIILVVALITFLIRAMPFLLFGRRKVPNIIVYLGSILPQAIMVILIIYCLISKPIITYPYLLPELISIIIVAGLHIWKRNTLLSVGVGTIAYMLLIQFVFI